MTVFAISDLHMPAHEKPMDIFGPQWENHVARIADDWKANVTDDDIVLLPGDLTWAMQLEAALEDIRFVGGLPGRKIILRGNHDYWWSAIGRVRRSLPEGMYALQNDYIVLDDIVFAGSRGWTIPMGEDADPNDVKIYTRERMRLEMSLKGAREKYPDAKLVTMMHYPPLTDTAEGFSDILEAYNVDHCVYGHLHGAALYGAIKGLRGRVRYHQVSCDGLGFKLYRLNLEQQDEEVSVDHQSLCGAEEG
ncbi:MAG: metallophosphoesterase [Clostridia bacterium]|nr:metallophosphoesterase [Clostridia bacterium]